VSYSGGKVYVIQSDVGVKVGVSTHPKNRNAQLRRGRVVYESPTLDHAYAVEKCAHRLLCDVGQHLYGEWWSASVEAAIQAISRAIVEVGNNPPGKSTVGKMETFIMDAETRLALDDVRASGRKIESKSAAVRRLIMEEAARVRATKKQQ
jgi:hypothetical protein